MHMEKEGCSLVALKPAFKALKQKSKLKATRPLQLVGAARAQSTFYLRGQGDLSTSGPHWLGPQSSGKHYHLMTAITFIISSSC